MLRLIETVIIGVASDFFALNAFILRVSWHLDVEWHWLVVITSLIGFWGISFISIIAQIDGWALLLRRVINQYIFLSTLLLLNVLLRLLVLGRITLWTLGVLLDGGFYARLGALGYPNIPWWLIYLIGVLRLIIINHIVDLVLASEQAILLVGRYRHRLRSCLRELSGSRL